MQEILKVPSKRNSLIGSVVFHLLLLLIFLFSGFTEPDPLPEPPFVSVSLALGTTDAGQGNTPTVTPSDNPPTPEQQVQEEQVEAAQPVVAEEVATVDQSESVVKSDPSPDPPADPQPVADPAPVNKFENAFAAKKASGGGSGDDKVGGSVGRPEGSVDGKATTPGSGGSGPYNLAGRAATVKIKPKYNCQETGKVVITVRVDRSGKTTSVEVDGKNSDNLADCLTNAAKAAALKTEWEAKPNAPTIQFGSITYLFELN